MMLLTKEQRTKLLENGKDNGEVDHKPVVKFFNPVGSATWLLSELDADGDTLFGLCDLGMGFPEVGYVLLSELESISLPLGLTIERDRGFKADKTLSEYADEARRAERIVA